MLYITKNKLFKYRQPRSGQSLAAIEAAAFYWHNNELFVQRVAELNRKREGVLAFAQERGARSAGRGGRPGTARASATYSSRPTICKIKC